MRKGFFFSLDALIAALLIVGGILLIAKVTDPDTDTSQLQAASEDAAVAINTVRIYELNAPLVKAMIANGTIEDPNATVIEQMGFFWATGNDDHARQIASILLDGAYPGYGMRLTYDGDVLYNRSSPKGSKDIISASRMVTGVGRGEAIKGSSGSAYLRKIKQKRTSAFTVFGGFIGQGNISARFDDLPGDANITRIAFEAAASGSFEIYFNGIRCGGTYVPFTTNGTPDGWDLSLCNGSIDPGVTNIMSINFTQNLNESYIAGGFLKIKYRTQLPVENTSASLLQYWFPGIEGIANLYDGFYVPGTLNNMTVYLHYNASNASYLQIGEKRVWDDQPNGTEKRVVLNDSYLRSPTGGKLDYDLLSNNTNPLRFAGFELEGKTEKTGNADVVVITDFSGSMKKAVGNWDLNQGNLGSDCDSEGAATSSPGVYDDDTIRKTRLATCVDKVLVTAIMNYSGNRIWPIFLYGNEIRWYNNPEDESALKGYIDSFGNGKDKTCYACAFNRAYEILDSFSTPDRKKFIVFMTDGVPTHCADGSCMSTSTLYGAQQCDGLCDTQGSCDSSNIPAQCSQCQTFNGGQMNAYYSANRSVNDFNATIFTVGFGPIDDCSLAGDTLQEIADIGNGTYQHSSNSTELKLIYENISQEIILRTELVDQVVLLQGNISPSQLFDDSHINITYTRAKQYDPLQNTLDVTLHTDQECNPVLPLYAEQELVEAQAISYSGLHWTDFLFVNGVDIYNLSKFLKPYGELGDPTLVNAPLEVFSPGNNTIFIETGDGPLNRTGCSVNNSAIYRIRINLSTERSRVVENADGCVWTVQFEDDTLETYTIPSSYSGTNECSYRPGDISYDPNDAYQLATYELLARLDFSKTGKLFVNLREEDLEIVVTTISGIPYLWGPAIARIEVIR